MSMWVHLFCLLLVGLKVCGTSRLLLENNGLYIAPPQNLKVEVACEEAGETKPWSTSENDTTKDKANNLEFRFRENRTGGDAKRRSAGFNVQGLSTSEPSPGVGHMQVFRGAMKCVHKERILGSTPSPGAGN